MLCTLKPLARFKKALAQGTCWAMGFVSPWAWIFFSELSIFSFYQPMTYGWSQSEKTMYSFLSVKCLYYVHVKVFIIWYIVLASRFDTMPKKFKKRPEISTPQNFEHRVHTGFDSEQGKYVGLPPQWAGLIIPEEKTERRRPLIDPSSITHTEIAPLKVIGFIVLVGWVNYIWSWCFLLDDLIVM